MKAMEKSAGHEVERLMAEAEEVPFYNHCCVPATRTGISRSVAKSLSEVVHQSIEHSADGLRCQY